MRTTVTIDADVESLLKAAMKRSGASFKDTLNSAVRRGLSSVARPQKRLQFPGLSMQMRPGVNLDKALNLAAELEDEELTRRLQVGK